MGLLLLIYLAGPVVFVVTRALTNRTKSLRHVRLLRIIVAAIGLTPSILFFNEAPGICPVPAWSVFLSVIVTRNDPHPYSIPLAIVTGLIPILVVVEVLGRGMDDLLREHANGSPPARPEGLAEWRARNLIY
jgi:hypothetical protein